MKGILKYMIAAATILPATSIHAQTTSTTTAGATALAEVKAPSPVDAKEITVTLKNDCDNHLNVFAGDKKEAFSGKSQAIGGRSTDVLYMKTGEVVCIMTAPKVIQACTTIKEGVSKIEINTSGNGFVK